MSEEKLTIVVGHSGSGKSEFVAGYALYLKNHGGYPVIADLDIVNPYFRLRELKEYFKSQDIRVISSNYEDDYHMDMPALAASLQTCFTSDGKDGIVNIVDVGGDPSGAHVLARYAESLRNKTYNMWIVVNANRPQTANAESAAACIAAIENASRLKINGLINSTHMLKETSVDDILKGNKLIEQLSKITGIPVVYTLMEEKFEKETENIQLSGKRFIVKPLMQINVMERLIRKDRE
ncbi:hypothetical protein AGMMS49983_07980 [Clostridia bacterium]|nr:hypothetical protein AGMMS49983_07980 [Clostridia bacterium]